MSDHVVAFVYSELADDPDLGDLVELFVAELPDRLDHLVRQFDDGNRQTMRRAVHQMKGAAGSYGFHAVTPLAARLEQSLNDDGSDERVKADLDALLDLCRRIRSGTSN